MYGSWPSLHESLSRAFVDKTKKSKPLERKGSFSFELSQLQKAETYKKAGLWPRLKLTWSTPEGIIEAELTKPQRQAYDFRPGTIRAGFEDAKGFASWVAAIEAAKASLTQG